MQKNVIFLEKEPKKNAKDINYQKVRDHSQSTQKYKGAVQSICNLKFKVVNEIPVVFHNSSNYDYHFIIKEFTNEFEEQFECPGEKNYKDNYKHFSVPIRKEITNIDKNGNKSVETIFQKIGFLDSMRFMATSLSKLVDNLTQGIHKIKSKDCDWFFEYKSLKDNLICLFCNKDHSTKFDEKLKKKFKNTFKFSNNGINQFVLLLRKGVYLYEYIDDLEKV